MAQTDPGQVFRDAADILRRDGWQQRSPLADGPGTHCLLDAVAEAKGLPHQYSELTQSDKRWASPDLRPEGKHLASVIAEQEKHWQDHARDPYSAAYWNDMPGRTEDEVLALLEKAATSAPVDL